MGVIWDTIAETPISVLVKDLSANSDGALGFIIIPLVALFVALVAWPYIFYRWVKRFVLYSIKKIGRITGSIRCTKIGGGRHKWAFFPATGKYMCLYCMRIKKKGEV